MTTTLDTAWSPGWTTDCPSLLQDQQAQNTSKPFEFLRQQNQVTRPGFNQETSKEKQRNQKYLYLKQLQILNNYSGKTTVVEPDCNTSATYPPHPSIQPTSKLRTFRKHTHDRKNPANKTGETQ